MASMCGVRPRFSWMTSTAGSFPSAWAGLASSPRTLPLPSGASYVTDSTRMRPSLREICCASAKRGFSESSSAVADSPPVAPVAAIFAARSRNARRSMAPCTYWSNRSKTDCSSFNGVWPVASVSMAHSPSDGRWQWQGRGRCRGRAWRTASPLAGSACQPLPIAGVHDRGHLLTNEHRPWIAPNGRIQGRSPRAGLRDGGGDLIEAQLQQLQIVVVVLPVVVLQGAVEQVVALDGAIPVDVGVQVQQLLRDVGEGRLAGAADLHAGVDAAPQLARGRIGRAGGLRRRAARLAERAREHGVRRRAAVGRVGVRQLERSGTVGAVRVQHLEVTG